MVLMIKTDVIRLSVFWLDTCVIESIKRYKRLLHENNDG